MFVHDFGLLAADDRLHENCSDKTNKIHLNLLESSCNNVRDKQVPSITGIKRWQASYTKAERTINISSGVANNNENAKLNDNSTEIKLVNIILGANKKQKQYVAEHKWQQNEAKGKRQN